MKILLIDGEYLRKLIELENLEELLRMTFGIINYPDKIIYYSAMISEEQSKILLKIKNMEINNKGYISKQDNGKNVQKAVDGYIIADILLSAMNKDITEISVIAGDGDLTAGFEKSLINFNKKINLLASKNSISDRLSSYSNVFYLEDFYKEEIKEKNTFTKEIVLNDNINNLKKLWLKEQDNNWVSGTKIGQKKKLYNFTYVKGSLNKILETLEKNGLVELRPENGSKTKGYDLKFL